MELAYYISKQELNKITMGQKLPKSLSITNPLSGQKKGPAKTAGQKALDKVKASRKGKKYKTVKTGHNTYKEVEVKE